MPATFIVLVPVFFTACIHLKHEPKHAAHQKILKYHEQHSSAINNCTDMGSFENYQLFQRLLSISHPQQFEMISLFYSNVDL